MTVGLLLRRSAVNLASIESAFLQFGIAGLAVGATVGIGATVGPRPALNPLKCVFAQAVVALSSGVGGFIGSLFPQVFSAADQAVRDALANRGIMIGSWFGAVAGTILEIIHVYRMRRKAADRST
jgi:Na+/H+ antiporter NhaA